jgi:hypothetical protein
MSTTPTTVAHAEEHTGAAEGAEAAGARGSFKEPRFNTTEILRVPDAEILKAAGLTPAPGEAPLDTARRHLGTPLPDLIEPD